VVALDPAEARGSVTYEHAGLHTVPGASYQMRFVTYFVRFADLVVTVEGWMVHAAYSLGKRYRVLMLPYSHPSRWHPYGRTLHQDVAELDSNLAPAPSSQEAGAPPLPEQPRKFVLLFLLGSLGRTGNVQAVPLLRWALQSEDRDVRLAATNSLATFSGPDIDAALGALLADPANRVRGVAAAALLERTAGTPSSLSGLRRENLLAHEAIGREARDWVSVLRLGTTARSAIETALNDDDPVVRREAAEIMHLLDRRAMRSTDQAGRSRSLHRLHAVGRGGSARMVALLRRLRRRPVPSDASAGERPTVLILTPVKDAADCLDGYAKSLHRLTYPHGLISIGFLESDSSDTTFADLQRRMSALGAEFRRARLWKKDFGYRIPPGVPRWEPTIQMERRTILAKSRNHLLFHALDDEAWVLWLDVDVVAYPPDLIERLLATEKDVVQPHCVLEPGGRTFDLNGWRDQGRLHLHDLRGEGDLVELDAVGGTVLLVRADVHREGLVFPAFLYGAANPRVRTDHGDLLEGPLTGKSRRKGSALWRTIWAIAAGVCHTSRSSIGESDPMIDPGEDTVRPQLLYLSPVVPATSGNGLAMRSGMVLQLLSKHYSLSLLVVRLYPPYDAPLPATIARLCSRAVLVSERRTAQKPLLFPLQQVLTRFGRTMGNEPPLARTQMEEAGTAFEDDSFDVVHVFRIVMLPFARSYIEVPDQTLQRHLDLDDVESTTHRRLADLYRLNGKNTLAQAEDARAERAGVLETQVLGSFDRLYVCSEEDKARLPSRAGSRICVLPNALPLPGPLPPKRSGGPFTFIFVGTLGYYPNEDAVLHFCTEVVPLIRRASRQPIRVMIVGTGVTPAIRQLRIFPEVELIGPVPDVAPWYAQADAAIIPLRAGGGTRIKVLEAFCYECPVVSTSIGIEGIAARAEEHVLIGNTPEALAEQCLRLMADPALADRLATGAAALFRRSYTFEAVAESLDVCS
jgi:glycosyltransferase involved in cell wall biosynthesis